MCAHRGARMLHRDNSPEAFRAAIAQGADMLETDVRRSLDGRLVLAHDPLTGGAAAGAMSLGELVGLAHGRAALDLELKEAGYESQVLAAVEPRPRGLVVTSFLPECVAAVRALDPQVAAGLLVGPNAGGDPLALARDCGAVLLAPHETLVDRSLLDRTRAAGMPLAVWTVNAARRLGELCREPGVAVVITDDPALGLAVRDGQPSGSVSASDSG
ncbi:MAG: glycerophosphodiester phosphodiesterase [Gaiellales bacterium]